MWHKRGGEMTPGGRANPDRVADEKCFRLKDFTSQVLTSKKLAF